MKGGVSWMREGGEKESGSVVSHEASGMGGFVLVRVKVKSERWVWRKGLTKRVMVRNGGVKGMKDVLGRNEGICMNLGGIMLWEGFEDAECRKSGGKCRSSGVTGTEVMFEMRGKGEGLIKGETVGTGARGRGGRREIMPSAKIASWMSAQHKSGGRGDR